jgi:hypothetical protein
LDDQLLVIDVVAVRPGVAILQTIWRSADPVWFGRRQTRTEQIRDQASLRRRLHQLVPLIAGHLPETVADIGDDLRAAAA